MITFFEHMAESQGAQQKIMYDSHQASLKSQQDILFALTADRREQDERERREAQRRDERASEEAKERLDRYEKEMELQLYKTEAEERRNEEMMENQMAMLMVTRCAMAPRMASLMGTRTWRTEPMTASHGRA